MSRYLAAHVQLNNGVRGQRDRSRIAAEAHPVHVSVHRSGRRTNPGGRERLLPDVEVVSERVEALNRRLDVDDPVAGVRVQPVEAADDANSLWDHPGFASDKYHQLGVDVVNDLLRRLAGDAVYGFPLRLAGGRG